MQVSRTWITGVVEFCPPAPVKEEATFVANFTFHQLEALVAYYKLLITSAELSARKLLAMTRIEDCSDIVLISIIVL